MKYTVKAVIQSNSIDAGAPVDVQWYNGDSLAQAIAAAAQAAARHEDDDEHVPWSVRTRTLSVRVDFTESADEMYARLARQTVTVDGDLEVTVADIAHAEQVVARLAENIKPGLVRFDSESHDYSFDDCCWTGIPAKGDCAGPRIGLATYTDGWATVMCERHANLRAGNPV